MVPLITWDLIHSSFPRDTSIFTIHPCSILPPPIFDEQLPWARPCSRHGWGRQWTEETQHLLGAHPVISSDRHTNH